jgi:hypothetical protein
MLSGFRIGVPEEITPPFSSIFLGCNYPIAIRVGFFNLKQLLLEIPPPHYFRPVRKKGTAGIDGQTIGKFTRKQAELTGRSRRRKKKKFSYVTVPKIQVF